jgi:hypothetical protein
MICQTNIRVAVVTAIFLIETEKIDECGTLVNKNENWDYILFTNNKNKLQNVENWEIREIDCSNCVHGVYASKQIKWLTHDFLPDYDIIIWVDSFIVPNLNMIDELNTMINSVYTDPKIPIIMRTQLFKCINDDIQWCLKNNRITDGMSKKIINHINNSGVITVDECVQTYWSSAIVKNNKHIKLQNMAKELFTLVTEVGYRDQHWLPYLFKKYDLYCDINKTKNIFIITGKQIKENHNYVTFF